MSQGEILTIASGNLTGDPEIKFTSSGAAVAKFRVACTPRRFNRQTTQFEPGKTTFVNVEVWRAQAENVAETLKKGMAVIVSGRWEQDEYTTREGEKRTVYSIVEATVAIDLSFQVATVSKSINGTNPGAGAQNNRPAPAATPAQQPYQAPAQSAGPVGGLGLNEPPF